MKIIKNEKLIKRNGTIANYIFLAALATLGVSIYFSYKQQVSFIYALAALVLIYILMQISTYMTIRFGPSPRLDEKLDAGLKGLPGEFVIYHYTTPVSHLLVGPAGVWILLPYPQGGRVAFRKNRWRNTGGGFIQSYMRLFGVGSLGRPDIDAESEVNSLKKYLSKHMEEGEIPEISTLLVFTNEHVELEIEEAPLPAMKLKQIKDFIRQKSKEKKVSPETLSRLKNALE